MATESAAFGMQVKFRATAVLNLLEVTMPDLKMDSKETTHHGLTDRWRTFRKVLAEAGEGEFKFQINVDQFATLVAKFDASAANDTWQVIFPTSPAITFNCSGFLSELKQESAPVDGILEASCKFKCSGKPTIS